MNGFLYLTYLISFSSRFHIPWKQTKWVGLKLRHSTLMGSFEQLQNASRRALHLWSRDAASVGFADPRSKAESEISSYAQTMIGSGSRDGLSHSPGDHRILCNNCHRVSQIKAIYLSKNLYFHFSQMIVGVRYQCGHCPTSPSSFNLVCFERKESITKSHSI